MSEAEATSTPIPGTDSGEDANYLTISLVVAIPCSVVILALGCLISLTFYLTCKSPSHDEEQAYVRRRFQGISLEQQRQAKAKRNKRKRVTERRESGVSGNFNPRLSRSPSTLSALANPFGLQEWQIRMYGGSGPGAAGGRRSDGSPETEETDISSDEMLHHRGSSGLTGAINPLMVVSGQDHDPGYDTPPRRKRSEKTPQPLTLSHPPPPPNSHSHTAPSKTGPSSGGRNFLVDSREGETDNSGSSSDDSMNPYDS